MPNQLNQNGLQIATAAETTQNLVTGFQSIYGNAINVDQNSPDGQRIGIFTQIITDLLELIQSVYNSFDPDQAVGVVLDQRVTINNIQRQGGTYTVQPISITVNQPITLAGLDGSFNDPNGTGYTVQDASGNQFILETTTALTAGTTVCNFRAATIGVVNVPANTITVPVTIVLGVTGINNPSSAITVGQAEETDAQLRTRRQRSVAIASTGYLNGLLGKVLALQGVTEAVLYENNTGSTDANGTPAHTIWLVVAGGSSSDIANALYTSKSYGAGMRGSVTQNIITASGGLFVAAWDVPAAVPLYIQFQIKKTISTFTFNTVAITAYIAANLAYGIGAYTETSAITAIIVAAIAAQGGGGVPIEVKVSTDNATWVDYIAAPTPASQFTVAAANISITVV